MDMDHQEAAECAACKYMRFKCPPNCIFAPYFPDASPSFGYVHCVYGCSNVGKILQSLPVEQRRVAAETLAFEAEARIRDPVFGCVGYIFLLQQHLGQIERDIQEAEAQIYAAGYQPPPRPPLEQHWFQMPQLTMTTTVPQHQEQPDELLLPTGTAYPSMPQEEPIPQPISEILPISSTAPQQDDPQLMTDGEVQDFAAELEDFLGDGDIQEAEAQIPAAGYQAPPPPKMTTMTVPPQQDDPQLMTDAEVQDFAAELEDFLGDGDIQEAEVEIPAAGYQAPPPPQMTTTTVPPQQDDPQLMTDAEVQDFASELEDLLG